MAVRWQAEVAPDPRLLVLNERLAADLGLDAAWLHCPDGLKFLVGNLVPDGATPVAQAYAGHQFGGFVPRLGDGRALAGPAIINQMDTTTLIPPGWSARIVRSGALVLERVP